MANFCKSSIGLSQQSHHARYWVFRDYIYDFPTLNSFFLFLYKNGCPQWAAVLLTHLMFSKRQNLALVQLIYASRPIMHDIGFCRFQNIKCVWRTAAHSGQPFYTGIRRKCSKSENLKYSLYKPNIVYDGSAGLGQLNRCKILPFLKC